METREVREKLLNRKPLPPLRPHALFQEDLTDAIEQLPVPVLEKAGLHLLNDDLEHCHTIVQANETPDGNFFHAILHRREGDFENSLYWYRRVGEHPALKRMAEEFPDWTPETFIERCKKEDAASLQEQQLAEMRFLLASIDLQE